MNNIIKFLISILLVLLIIYFYNGFENFSTDKRCYNIDTGIEMKIEENGQTCYNYCKCEYGVPHEDNICLYGTKHYCKSCNDGEDPLNGFCKNNSGNYLEIANVYSDIEKEYPPTRENINNTEITISDQTYGNGTYIFSQSSIVDTENPNNYAYGIFGNDDNNPGYVSIQNYRCGSSSVECTSNTTKYASEYLDSWNLDKNYIEDSYYGEWVKIKLPIEIKLTKYIIKRDVNDPYGSPAKYRIYGSKDDIVWFILVDKTSEINYTDEGSFEEIVDTNHSYKYFALVCNEVYDNRPDKENNLISLKINRWHIFGKDYIKYIQEPVFIKSSNYIIQETINDEYKYIVFKNDLISDSDKTSHDITFPENTECDILIVAGGGGGGNSSGGGGGSGQAIISLNNTLKGEYTIMVGKGGKGFKKDEDESHGENGSDSIIIYKNNIENFSDTTSTQIPQEEQKILFKAKGGGGGGSYANNGKEGGSWGGNGGGQIAENSQVYNSQQLPIVNGKDISVSAETTSVSQENFIVLGSLGGNGINSIASGGGGGGLGEKGSDAISNNVGSTSTRGQPGKGGNGIYEVLIGNNYYNLKEYFSPNTNFGIYNNNGYYYIGGGGGGGGNDADSTRVIYTNGGFGGGGKGRSAKTHEYPDDDSNKNLDAKENTGSGGGGGSSLKTTRFTNDLAGKGGSGIVIIRYKYKIPYR